MKEKDEELKYSIPENLAYLKQDMECMSGLLKVIERRIITGHKRYGGTYRKYGVIMNFYNIARKFIRIENKYHNKSLWYDMEGDTLLDTYIDMIIYCLFGIILSLENGDIHPESIDKILKEQQEEEENENNCRL